MGKTFEMQVEEIMETEQECVFFFESEKTPIENKLYQDNITAFDFTNFDIVRLNYEDYEEEFETNEFPNNQPAFFHFDKNSELNIIELLMGK